MKQCPKCNCENEDDNIICKNCGYLFNAEGEAQQQAPHQVNESVPSYYQPSFQNQPTVVKNNGLAVASLVLGIISIPFLCCYLTGIIPAILAVIFGFIARNKIKNSNGMEKGDGMALAGIIIGFIAIAIGIVAIVSIAANWDKLKEYYQQYYNKLQEKSLQG